IAIVLSGWAAAPDWPGPPAAATFGQAKCRPPAVTVEPGVIWSAASPSAENVVPIPSKPVKPDDGLVSESDVIPALSKVADRFAYGTRTCTALLSDCLARP